MRIHVIRTALAAGCISLLPATVLGQGAIGGVVRDASGGVLPGVTVEAASPALIERVRSVVTDGNGQYLIVDLRPGSYSVTFRLAGFTTLTRDGLELSAGVTLPINAELKVGAIEETVTVSGVTPVVDVQNTRVQTEMMREMLDAIPRTRGQAMTGALLPGIVVQASYLSDVGGSSGEPVPQLAIHGGDQNDQIWAVDGMKISEGGTGARRGLIVADNTAQEYVYETSALSAEFASGGVRMNLVPKEGGNTFKGTIFGAFTTQGMTSDNLNARLRDRGLTSTTKVDRIWDFSPALGGPILRDRLWFFTTYRNWGAINLPAGAFYRSDPTKPGFNKFPFSSANGRLTWQATSRNKLSAYHDNNWRTEPFVSVSSLTPPEAATARRWVALYLTQAKWTSPVTNRVLLEAGFYHFVHNFDIGKPSPAALNPQWEAAPANPKAWPILELSTGQALGGPIPGAGLSPSYSDASWYGESGAVSYVTGSHAFKVGFTHVSGRHLTFSPPVPPILRLLNGQPFQVQLIAKPGEARLRLNHDLGLYAQDQWKLRRLTLNLGIRFDYFNGQIDPQNSPAGQWFLEERNYDQISNVPNWKDISPRFGGAYDVFGNGKTAIKASVSHYIKSDMTTFQGTVNPMAGSFALGATDLRSWSDLNRDGLPEPNELGPSTNRNFGKPVFPVYPAGELRTGWGKRLYNWEYAVGIQHELLPRLSLNVGYYRRSYGNLTWTDNLLVESSEYTPFTIASPLDGQPITSYNLDPAKRGLSNNLLTFAPDNSQVFNGVDISVSGKFGGTGILGGGVSMGRTVTDSCTTDDPNALRFCKVTPPFMAGNQYKFMWSYTLPYDVQASGTFVNIPGPLIAANYTVSSAIAGIPLTQGSLTVNLVEPGTLYGDRMNRVDLRFGKNLRIRSTRFQPCLDLLNVFNASPILIENSTYGPTWRRPTTILVGRMFQMGMHVDF